MSHVAKRLRDGSTPKANCFVSSSPGNTDDRQSVPELSGGETHPREHFVLYIWGGDEPNLGGDEPNWGGDEPNRKAYLWIKITYFCNVFARMNPLPDPPGRWLSARDTEACT